MPIEACNYDLVFLRNMVCDRAEFSDEIQILIAVKGVSLCLVPAGGEFELKDSLIVRMSGTEKMVSAIVWPGSSRNRRQISNC